MTDHNLTDEIFEIFGTEILTQDNRITAHPIYYVEQRKRIYGMDPRWAEDDFYWVYSEDHERVDDDDEIVIGRYVNEGLPVPEDFEKLYYLDTWEFVQPFFTLRSAEKYIEANSHNLNHPRVFVDSAYRNKEWIFIRELLIKVAKGEYEE